MPKVIEAADNQNETAGDRGEDQPEQHRSLLPAETTSAAVPIGVGSTKASQST